MLNLSLFSAHIWLFFLAWAHIGSWISIFFLFPDFLKERFLLLFCFSNDESLRFDTRDSKAVVLNIFQFITIWKHRLCHFLSEFFAAFLSLSFSLSVPLSHLVFVSFMVAAVEYTASSKHWCFSFIVFEWNVFFFTLFAQVMRNFWFWSVIVRLCFWILFVVLKQSQYAFRFVLGFHV